MHSFMFELGDRVMINDGRENGHIIGRAEYSFCVPSYMIRYIDGTGCAVERWWSQDALTLVGLDGEGE